ncbi:MAG: hypothetical protein ABFS14_03395 [Gemmatimonadota bacterium]
MPPIESSPPVANPSAVQTEARAGGPEASARIRFEWHYSDRRGAVSGDGVARYNPPDSVRLDLFTSGEIAMAVALRSGSLGSLGQIESVELPEAPFLYAMAGLFEPGDPLLPNGFVVGGDTVLVYPAPNQARRYFFLHGSRISKVEETRAGRTTRRVSLEWEAGAEWPSRVEYRDFQAPSRVSWDVTEVRPEEVGYAPEIFDLPVTP